MVNLFEASFSSIFLIRSRDSCPNQLKNSISMVFANT